MFFCMLFYHIVLFLNSIIRNISSICYVPNRRIKALDLMSQTVHLLLQLISFRSQLPNVIRSFLQHCGLAEFHVGVLTELRYQTVQRIKPILDVVSAFLFRVNVADSSLLFILSSLRFALNVIASGRQRTA